MATKTKKAPAAPVALTEEQLTLARKGYSARVFEAMEPKGSAKKAKAAGKKKA